jgi:hypothetical protein
MNRPCALTLVMILTASPCVGRAEWLRTGNPIGVTAYPVHARPSAVISDDGSGGAYVAWYGPTYPGYGAVVLSHLDADGRSAEGWPADGLLLHPYPWWGRPFSLFADDYGGALVISDAIECAASCGADPHVVLAEHMTGAGALANGWSPSGLRVSEPSYEDDRFGRDGRSTAIANDERGGAIVVWSHNLGLPPPGSQLGGGPVELRAQRVDGSGRLLWGDSPVIVRSATNLYPFEHSVAADGRGGAFVFWRDDRPPGVFAQHLSELGSALWRADGVPVVRSPFVVQGRLKAIADGAGGALVAWTGTTHGDSGLYVTQVSADGSLSWREDAHVVASPSLTGFRIVAVEGSGAILSWITGGIIHAQRINPRGRLSWSMEGVWLSSAPSHRDFLAMAPDGHQGVYIAWSDTVPEGEVFATHLDGAGAPMRGWSAAGTPVCPHIASVFSIDLASDGAGGALMTWTDARSEFGGMRGYDLPVCFATKLGRDGPAATANDRHRPLAGRLSASPHSIAGLSLQGVQPSPGSAIRAVRFSLADGSPASLDLFDVAGRKVISREVGSLGAGAHELQLDPGLHLAPGVYALRLCQSGRQLTTRVVLAP